MRFFAVAGLLALAGPALAAGQMHVSDAWIRAMPAGIPSGAPAAAPQGPPVGSQRLAKRYRYRYFLRSRLRNGRIAGREIYIR